MNQQRKNDILASAKTNRVEKIPIVESPYPPEEQNVIWLKDGVMYYFDNNEWEALFSSDEGGGGDDPQPEPTPEPLDPTYVQTPLNFANFEVIQVGDGNRSSVEVLCASANVESQNAHFQDGDILNGILDGDYVYREYYKEAELPLEEPEVSSMCSAIVSTLFTTDQFTLVSCTSFSGEGVAIIIANVGNQRKAILADVGNGNFNYPGLEYERLTAKVILPVIPEVDDIINIIPKEQYPIKLTPFVLKKSEEEGYTYATIAYYADGITGNIIDHLPASDRGGGIGTYQIYLDGSHGYRYNGLWNTSGLLSSVKNAFNIRIDRKTGEVLGTVSDIIPLDNNCVKAYFGYSNQSTSWKYQGYVYTTKSKNVEGKTLIVFSESDLNESYFEIQGTGLTDEQILEGYFEKPIEQIYTDQIHTFDTVYDDGMG